MDQATTQVVEASAESSLADILGLYDRLLSEYVVAVRRSPFSPYQEIPVILLKSFNLAFVWRFWRDDAGRFLRIPNSLNQDLLAGDVLLSHLAALGRPALDAVAECNRINLDRVVRRSVFGLMPQLAAGVVALVGGAKALQELFGLSMPFGSSIPSDVRDLFVYGLVGLALGSVLNFVISQPRIGVLRAFADLVAIARAYRAALEGKGSSGPREQGVAKEPPN